MSAPKALLRMFSGRKKDSTPSPTASTHDLRRTTLSNSSAQLSREDSNSDHQSRTSLSSPRDSTRNISRGSIAHSPTSKPAHQNHSEEMLSPKSYGSVRPFATAAPASAAFTYGPTRFNHNEAINSASLNSGPSSDTTELVTPHSSEKGSGESNPSANLNDQVTPIEFSRPHSVSQKGMDSASKNNLRIQTSGTYLGDSQLGSNSPSSQGTTPLSPGITSLINRGLSGTTSEEGENKALRKEISRLTRELAELGEDRDRQVAKIGVLRAELGRSEASLKSEQLSGRQELEALLELQAQHQALQRVQCEREAEIQILSTEKAEFETKLSALQSQLQETAVSSSEYTSLLVERKQLRGWLDEEKERHNEVRQELAQARALIRNSEARINHLEMVAHERQEEIHNLEKRDMESNECTQREVNYYQEQLNEALRSRDEMRDELDRTKEQVRILRHSMEQLLKAGAADDGLKSATFSPHSPRSKTSSITDSSFLKGASMSLGSFSRSACSEDLESMTSSEFLAQPSASGCIRYGLGHERRSTFGLENVMSEASSPYQAHAEPPMTPVTESYTMSPRLSLSKAYEAQPPRFPSVSSSVTSPTSDKSSTPNDSVYWDQRLKELLKEKERVNLEYGRIPTSRITVTIRKRKENLEQTLDQLDADIAGARSKLRALVI
ncbi:hypothetical protein DSO57_1028130 [Entomophthora muscae]|uniref:Uncharacterized protein n=1 Tax=Entomophthora muscae TaxID=34485 RepID=A0ACC2RSM9_9FUNG|nr:hypothetical protein DSO57_1028130 [Entomophthora muscae]